MNKAGTKFSKLDRFLLSSNGSNHIPDAKVMVLDRKWSDHSPILLHLRKDDYGPIPFKFFKSWLQRPNFDDVIVSGLTEFNNVKLHTKLKLLKNHIKSWAAHTRVTEKTRLSTVMELIAEIDCKLDSGSAM
ncbi:uncharacterized protein [Rutidosis leptorrhynchoides]|uniref:uncharacterized protein n=1 Tax=Rutidosis leptorrhynchoides TaxID=125765 RepID=UPI003A9999DA